jgi:hypothetical protein
MHMPSSVASSPSLLLQVANARLAHGCGAARRIGGGGCAGADFCVFLLGQQTILYFSIVTSGDQYF